MPLYTEVTHQVQVELSEITQIS